MPPRRLGAGLPADASKAGPDHAGDHAKQVRALFSKWHKGRREAAMQQLQELAEAHPSGLALQALAKLQVLEGLRVAEQIEHAEKREAAVLQRLHSALEHSVHGMLDHRSLHCAVLALRLLRLCVGRQGAGLRWPLWEQIAKCWKGGSKGMGGLSDWADPSLEDLPVDVADDRWGEDLRTTRQPPAAWCQNVCRAFLSVRATCELEDMCAAMGTMVIRAGAPEPELLGVPLDQALVKDPHIPPAAKRRLSGYLASVQANRSAARPLLSGGATASSSSAANESGSRTKGRKTSKAEAKQQEREEELRAKREEMRRREERKKKEAQLREAQARAEKVKAYLLSRAGAGQAQAQWAALCGETSLRLEEFQQEVERLEKGGAISSEQAGQARTAAELMAKGVPSYCSLPPALQPYAESAQQGQHAQQGQQDGQLAGAAGGAAGSSVLGFGELEQLLMEAARRSLDMQEEERRLAEVQPHFRQLFENEKPVAQEGPGLVCSLPLEEIESVEVEVCQGDLEALQDPPSCLKLVPGAERDIASYGSGGGNTSSPDPDGREMKSELEQSYILPVACSQYISACIPELPPDQAYPEAVNAMTLHTGGAQLLTKRQLSQALLGHCLLGALRREQAQQGEPGAAAAEAARLREARRHANKLSMGKLIEAAAAEDAGAKERAAACILPLIQQGSDLAGWDAMKSSPVKATAQISLALAPRSAKPSEAAVLQVKQHAVEGFLLALRHLQHSGRLQIPHVRTLHAFLEENLGPDPQPEALAVPAFRPSSLGLQSLFGFRGPGRQAQQQQQRQPGDAGQAAVSNSSSGAGGGRATGGQGDPETSKALELVGKLARGLRRLGLLPLPELMRLHAYACLQLAWHYPEMVDVSEWVLEGQAALDRGSVRCEVTADGAIRITPAGLELFGGAEQGATKAGEGQEAPEAQQSSSEGSASSALTAGHGPAAALPRTCGGLAVAACGVEQLQAQVTKLAGTKSAEEDSAGGSEPGQPQAAALFAALQRLLALRALLEACSRRAFALLNRIPLELLRPLAVTMEAARLGPHAYDLSALAQTPPPGLCALLAVASSIEATLLEVQAVDGFADSVALIGKACSIKQQLADMEAFMKQLGPTKPAEQMRRRLEEGACTKMKAALQGVGIELMLAVENTNKERRRLKVKEAEACEKVVGQLTQAATQLFNSQRIANMRGFQVTMDESTGREFLEALEGCKHIIGQLGLGRLLAAIQQLRVLRMATQALEARVLSSLRIECAHSCAAEVGGVLLHHVLPAKWEAAMALAQGEPSSAAALPAPDRSKSDAAAEAAAAEAAVALLAEERREAERRERLERKKEKQRLKAFLAQQQRAAPSSDSEAGGGAASAEQTPPEQGEPSELPSDPEVAEANGVSESRHAEGAPALPQEPQPPAGRQQGQQQSRGSQEVPGARAGQAEALRPMRPRSSDVEPGERPLPVLSAAHKGGAYARLGSKDAQRAQQEPAASGPGAAGQQHPDPSCSKAGAANDAAPAAAAAAAAAAGGGRLDRAAAARLAAHPLRTGSSTAAAGSSPAATPKHQQHPRTPPKQQPIPGPGSAAAAATATGTAGLAAGPVASSQRASTSAGAASAGVPSLLEAELALARQQGLLGPDGEVDISRLGQLLDGPSAGQTPQPAQAAPGLTGQPAAGQGRAGLQPHINQQQQHQPPPPPLQRPGAHPAVLPPTRPAMPALEPPGSPHPAVPARQRVGSAGEAETKAQAQGKPLPPEMRFVRWDGEWVCRCGRTNPLNSDCKKCQQWRPCKGWFLGKCAKPTCPHVHLPFDLPPNRPHATPDGFLPDGRQIANPPPGYVYRKARTLPLPGPRPAAAAPSGWHPPPPPAPQQAATAQLAQGPLPREQAGHSSSQPNTPAGQAGADARALWPALGEEPVAQEPAPRAGPLQKPRAWGQPAAAPAAAGSVATTAAAAVAQDGPSFSGWGAGAEQAAAGWGAAAGPAQPPVASGAAHRKAWSERPQQEAASAPARTAAGASAQRAQHGPPSDPEQPGAVREDDDLASMLQNLGVGASGGTEAGAAGWIAAARVSGSAQQPVGQGAWPSIGQVREEAELQAAMQASLAHARQQHEQRLAGYPSGLPPPQQQQQAPASSQLARPGLANEAGEYNCFLNVIIQCLWYCTEFRQQVSAWPPALYEGRPVLRALRGLFAAFAAEEEGKRQRTIAAGARQAIDPTPLREALAALPQQGHLFRKGEMSDAAEVLDAIYQQINAAAGAAGVEALFGSAVREEVHCAKCRRTTQQSAYTQYFFNTQATAIRMQRVVAAAEEGAGAGPSLGRLLRLVEAQAVKTCDTDAAGCGTWNPVTHFLERAPRVFALQLAWESHHEEGTDIAATLEGVQPTIDLGEVYQAHEAGRDVYRLRSMVCYYGAHYQAFVLVPDLKRWLLFDDTRISNVGTWADVRTKCQLGRVQPSVLFYEKVTETV